MQKIKSFVGKHIPRSRNMAANRQPHNPSKSSSLSSSSLALLVHAPPVEYWNSNPYSVDISPDGKLMAFGSGGHYGGGGITLVDLTASQNDTEVVLRFGRPPRGRGRSVNACGLPEIEQRRDLTVSGVAFDGSGNYLAVSTWRSGRHNGPVYVFRCVESPRGIEHVATFSSDEIDGCPTGICWGEGGSIWVRRGHVLGEVANSLRRIETDIPGTKNQSQLSESRIATLGSEQVVTGISGHLVMMQADQPGQFLQLPQGDSDSNPITAVLSLPNQLLTGHLNGYIMSWEQNSEKQWRPRVTLRRPPEKKPHPDILFATYGPSSVVALCALKNGYFFSADASGEISQWNPEGNVMRTFELPRLGTPRCLAVQYRTPKGPLLVVGVKAPQKGSRRGFVVVFRLEFGWEQVGQWILMRRLTEEDRAAVKASDGGVVQKLLELDRDMFRAVLSFLLW